MTLILWNMPLIFELKYERQTLTIRFAAVVHQQFYNSQKAFSSGQVKRPVPHLSTGIYISPKLHQQLAHLCHR